MTKTALHTAMMAAQVLPPPAEGGDVPDWIHLAPAGEVHTFDNRGPYLIDDMQAVIERSMDQRGDLEIDVNHATFIAAPKGGDSPAHGWITEMQAREDGIWGKVEWTDKGRELVRGREYRRISPVFQWVKRGGKKVVQSILNASLVNRQNLRGQVALNQEETEMSFMERLAKLLGLDEDAGEDAILEAIKSMSSAKGEDANAEQISEIGVALGLEAGADADTVLNAAKEAASGSDDAIVTSLQATVTDLSGQIEEMRQGNARAAAEAAVDLAMQERRAGINATSRQTYIDMHMADPEKAETFIANLPKLGPSGLTVDPPAPKDGGVALNAEELAVAQQLGQSPEDFAKARAEEQEAS